MNPLTDSQSDFLRSRRHHLYDLVRQIEEAGKPFLTACMCDPSSDDCVICVLEEYLANAGQQIRELLLELDEALEAGPHPLARGRGYDTTINTNNR